MAPARAHTVLGWNRLALQALRAQSTAPSDAAHGAPTAARALAILQTCMYNAWAAYDDEARQTVHGVAVRLPRAERSTASKAGAMDHAACLVLTTLFPAQAAAFDANLASSSLAPGASPGQFSPAGIGRAQATSMLDAFCNDATLPFAPMAPGWAAVTADAGLDSATGGDAEAPPVRWCRLAHGVSARDGYDDDRDVLLYFVLSQALADAELAGADGGAAAAEVLRSFTGSDRAGANAAGAAASFSGIAAQDGRTRARAALAEGRAIGAQVFDKARRYWQGKL